MISNAGFGLNPYPLDKDIEIYYFFYMEVHSGTGFQKPPALLTKDRLDLSLIAENPLY